MSSVSGKLTGINERHLTINSKWQFTMTVGLSKNIIRHFRVGDIVLVEYHQTSAKAVVRMEDENTTPEYEHPSIAQNRLVYDKLEERKNDPRQKHRGRPRKEKADAEV